MNINLRTLPWFTTETIKFLNNVLRWYPLYLKRDINILEVGCGNSSFFFLSKPKIKLFGIESDEKYLSFIKNCSINCGYRTSLVDQKNCDNKFLKNTKNKLNLIFANKINSNFIKNVNFDIIIIDGIERFNLVKKIFRKNNKNQLIIIDNTEFAANWGKLNKSSAVVARTRLYRKILRSNIWKNYTFEQDQTSDSTTDITGFRSEMRWISSVFWNKKHLFNKIMVNNLGLPLVNSLGENDQDLKTLFKRCPYDFKNKKWLEKKHYPKKLDLGLPMLKYNWPKIKY
jgi:hypothetical protein